jgi:glycosyltransferase involved in cell wall biosynthesis
LLVRLLFIKELLAWPRSSGHDVHCFHMMKAMAEFGHEVSLATAAEPKPEALASLSLANQFLLDSSSWKSNGAAYPRLTYWQERFRSYWGIPLERIAAAGQAAAVSKADAIIVVGLNVLPYLGGIRHGLRVWYAADEWALHHLSLARWPEASAWRHICSAAAKGLYERVYAPLWDRVWVVSAADRRAMRWVAGSESIDVIANGVDTDYYQPQAVPELKRCCVFWGRLDFEPNVQALQWFCRSIWPALRRQTPDAQFRILGFQPGPAVHLLAGRDGITLMPDLTDIRAEIARSAVVVLPFRTRGGIKNKLLEAAGMGKAIVCTPQSCGGLRGLGEAPFVIVEEADAWVRKIPALWADAERRRRLGIQARQWVLRHHTWSATARRALAALEGCGRR